MGVIRAMLVDFLQFLFNLIIAGFVLRYAQVKLAGTDIGKALTFVY
jgi:hypothetical protein